MDVLLNVLFRIDRDNFLEFEQRKYMASFYPGKAKERERHSRGMKITEGLVKVTHICCLSIVLYYAYNDTKLSFNNTVERRRAQMACARNQVFLHGCLQPDKLHQLQSGKQCVCCYRMQVSVLTHVQLRRCLLGLQEWAHLPSHTPSAFTGNPGRQ